MVHQIDADGIVLSQNIGDLQLGAHSIRAGYKDRLAVALELKESSKEADIGQHFGTVGGAGVLLDEFLGSICRGDIYPRGGIGLSDFLWFFY